VQGSYQRVEVQGSYQRVDGFESFFIWIFSTSLHATLDLCETATDPN
jgi:hypothetical protein